MRVAVERRRFRRADIGVPIAISPLGQAGQAAEPITGEVRDVSLAGVYCSVKSPCPLKAGDAVVYSVAVPADDTRIFPFRRLAGRGWVARLEPIPTGRREGEASQAEPEVGLAIAFTPNVTAFASIEQ